MDIMDRAGCYVVVDGLGDMYGTFASAQKAMDWASKWDWVSPFTIRLVNEPSMPLAELARLREITEEFFRNAATAVGCAPFEVSREQP